MRSRGTSIGLAALLACAAIADEPAGLAGEELVKTHVIADERVQIEQGDRHLTGYEDVEFVPMVSACQSAVDERIASWLQDLKKVAASHRVDQDGVLVRVGLDAPSRGSISVNYQLRPATRTALLEIRYSGNERLTTQQRNQIVIDNELVALKASLMTAMKCQ